MMTRVKPAGLVNATASVTVWGRPRPGKGSAQESILGIRWATVAFLIASTRETA